MPRWDVSPAGVRAVLSRTEAEAVEFDGHLAMINEALFVVMGNVSSDIVAQALDGFMQHSAIPAVTSINARIGACMTAAGQATSHYVQGDLEMAQNAQAVGHGGPDDRGRGPACGGPMIDPKGIPEIPGNMTFVRHRALRLQRLGADVAGSGADIDSTWQGLAGVYEAPEAGELFAATGPVRTSSAALGDDFSAVGAALLTYADAVDEVKRQLASLRTKADAFVAVHGGSDDWHDDDDAVEHNNYLVHAVSVQVAMFAGAQRTCANAINAARLRASVHRGRRRRRRRARGVRRHRRPARRRREGTGRPALGVHAEEGPGYRRRHLLFFGGGLWDGAKENFWG